MSDDIEQEDWLRLGVAATLSRQYAADQRRLLESLGDMLEKALPEATRVERRGGLFSPMKTTAVRVDLGENRYELQDQGRGALRAARVHVVRGIALKSTEMPVEDWLTELGAALDERARASAGV